MSRGGKRDLLGLLESLDHQAWPTLVISLTVNGEARSFDAPIKVSALIDALALQGKRIALERNGDIVPRSRFGEEWLADGDRIEIVVAVGGG